MRTFFEDLGQKIAETAEKVTNKAEDAVEVTRMKSQIRNLENANKEDFITIGKKIYARYQAGEEISADYVDVCEAIQNRFESIKKYEQQISDVKGTGVCQSCGKHIPNEKESKFCPYCGEKLSEDVKEVVEEVKDKAEDMAGHVKDKAEGVVEHVKDKAEDAIDKAKEKTSDFIQDVCEKTAEKASDLLDD